jgi:acyl-CoA reductase-like NAD-dependent aldehyde dehydrogenase
MTLPASYRQALEELTTEDPPHPHLSTISDESCLALAKEILSNFYEKKNLWVRSGDWAREEAKLLRLSGFAAKASEASSRYNLASIVGTYLCTFVEALAFKLGTSNRKPDLLAKKRVVTDAHGCETEVYGPVGLPLPGSTFEVWTTPTKQTGKEDDCRENEDDVKDIGRISVVLCAGNQSFLSLIDILDNALRHCRPVLVKHHPLRPWLSEPYGIILEPLVRRGYLAQVLDVSNEATKALLSHPAVGHVHVTGALQTSQVVQEILQTTRPHLSMKTIKSMITSELGCATPQILDDGVYTELELQHACQLIVFGKKANGGCNCLSAQVVVLPKHWAQKDTFRSKLLEELKRQPTQPCYYPGSVERKASILEKCRKAGSKVTPVVAATLSEATSISDADHVVIVECGSPGEEGYNSEALLSEAFGPILAIVELDNSSSCGDDDYLVKKVVPFLNNKENIFGSLSCSIFTPASKGKVSVRKGMQSALAALQYGGVSVNQWNMFGYFTAIKGGMWGGHQLETLSQSGNGKIGDLYGIIGTKNAKSVVYGPPLVSKPMFDLASSPPGIIFEILLEFACSPSVFRGIISALKLVAQRSFYGFVSFLRRLCVAITKI